MARKAIVFHSEFKERLVIKIRAPEGDSPRAIALRMLVGEMNERYATGHLTEWLVETLIEKKAREVAGIDVPGISSNAVIASASNGGDSYGRLIESADVQRSQERGETERQPSPQITAPEPPTPEPPPVGQRVMPPSLRVMG